MRMRRRFHVTLAVGACLIAAGCGGAPARGAAQPTAFSEAPTAVPGFALPAAVMAVRATGPAARRLTVEVAVGGGCDETGTAAVAAVESVSQVNLTATVTRHASPKPPAPGTPCVADLILQRVDVQLLSPLGTRQVRDEVAHKVLAVLKAGR